MFFIDIYYYLLPNELTISLLWIGLLINLHGFYIPLSQAILGALIGYCLPWSIDSLYYLVRKKNGLGQGDWKLLAALGAWFGFHAMLIIFIAAIFLGSIVATIGLISKKLHFYSSLPFGPFLCISAWIFLLFGSSFII